MKKFGVFLWLVLFFNASIASADDIATLKQELMMLKKSYESRLTTLETRIQELESEQQIMAVKQEMKPTSFIENVTNFGNVRVGGYADIELDNFQNTDSEFDQHRFILNVDAWLSERLRFFSEYEIEHGGPDASGGGEAKVEQAWIDYLISDYINFRAGALLMPFGRYNLYHDSHLQDLTARPLVTRDVIPTTWTESGAGFHGDFDAPIGRLDEMSVGYEAYVVNGLDDGFSDTGLRNARGSLGDDNNNNKALVGRLALSPFLGHEMAFSGYYGKYNDSGEAITGGAVDFLSTWGNLELLGEYAIFDIDEPTGTNIADKLWGYYVQANYHFWPEFLNNTFLGRDFEDPTFTAVVRYGEVSIDDDSDTGVGNNEEDRITVGLNYRPVESFVIKLEYQWNHTTNETLERGDNDGFMASVAMGF